MTKPENKCSTTSDLPKRPRGIFCALNNKRGQSILEFAASLIFFVAFLYLVGEITRIMYSWVMLQYTANTTSREMRLEADPAVIESRFIEIADALGMQVPNSEVTATITPLLLIVEVDRDVQLMPLTATLTRILGDQSGTYPIYIREVVSRRVTNLTT